MAASFLVFTMGGEPEQANAASPYQACAAATIISAEGCPADPAQPCSIRSNVTLPAAASLCTFDFGTRAVSIGSPSSGGGKLDLGSKVAVINAGSLTVYPNGSIEGVGNGTTVPTNQGGMVTINVVDTLTLLTTGFQQGKIDVSGRAAGGQVTVTAGGNISVGATINAGQIPNAALASGGSVRLTSDHDILVPSEITVESGSEASGSASIDIDALGRVDISGKLTSSGSEGGDVSISAGTTVVVNQIIGTGEAGDGGSVTITANQDIQVKDDIRLRGASSTDGGACGGSLCIEATYGGINLSGNVLAEGGTPDGGGGDVELVARDEIVLGKAGGSATISVKGAGVEGAGGGLCIESAGDVTVQSTGHLDGSGGEQGGLLTLTAGRNMTLSGTIDVTGRSSASAGGTLLVESGDETSGDTTVSGLLDAGAGVCSPADPTACGLAGSITMKACNLTVSAAGEVRARAPDGGSLVLTARKQMTLQGEVNASRTRVDTEQGSITLRHVVGQAPTITGTIAPAATLQPMPPCTFVGQATCLLPCPQCGNGSVEFPETCDNNTGTPVNCDGCSAYCRLETGCDDGLLCTSDTCVPSDGCLSLPVLGCVEPTMPPTITPTPTMTRTPTRTLTPTRTRTPTITGTPTQTGTPTVTLPPSATSTPAPCPGDCNLDGTVSPSEFSQIISIINECAGSVAGCDSPGGDIAPCVAADTNVNGTISAGELTRIGNDLQLFARGCPP